MNHFFLTFLTFLFPLAFYILICLLPYIFIWLSLNDPSLNLNLSLGFLDFGFFLVELFSFFSIIILITIFLFLSFRIILVNRLFINNFFLTFLQKLLFFLLLFFNSLVLLKILRNYLIIKHNPLID